MAKVSEAIAPVIAVIGKPRALFTSRSTTVFACRNCPRESAPRAAGAVFALARCGAGNLPHPGSQCLRAVVGRGILREPQRCGDLCLGFSPRKPDHLQNQNAGAGAREFRSPAGCAAPLLLPQYERAPWSGGWGAFGVHQPAFDHFPFPIWSSMIMRHCRSPRLNAIHNIDPLGSETFREAICTYLRTARAVHCEPSQVMVVSGSQQALEISARVLLGKGTPFGSRNPVTGWRGESLRVQVAVWSLSLSMKTA